MVSSQILVVEDEGIVARSLQSELRNMGYRVPEIAATGEEAIEKAGAGHPDLVLMDIILKGTMDGIEAAQEIRSRYDIPIIYLTAYEDERTLGRAKATEPFGYLLKPYQERELHTTVEMALHKHQAEKQVRETKRWLFGTLRCIDEAVIATDTSRRIRFMNPVAETLTGCSERDAMGRDLQEVFLLCDEQTRAALASPAAQALREGRSVPLETHALLRARDGRERPVEGSDAPIRDEEGQLAGSVLVFRDTTERRRLEEQFRQAQKMEAVGRLAGGIAHDFNNLLTAILGYSDMLATDLRPGDPLHDGLLEIKNAGERAAALTRQLLSFSRRQVLQPRVVDLNALVADMDKMLCRVIGEDIDLVSVLDPAVGRVRADPGQLEQVIMNLAVNARDAMPGGGKLTLATATVFLDAEVRPGRYVLLDVSDTGCGMDAGTQARIFEPFFTTKDVGKGTGLGLATVYGIVKQSEGHIAVSSKPGRGTTIKVYLPEVSDLAVPAPVPGAAAPFLRGQETVLLVEDEAALRLLMLSMLRQSGYMVLQARDGTEALRLSDHHHEPIHLLVSDVLMPRMTGPALAEALAERRPALKVLYVSGYTDHAILPHDLLRPGVAFLQKPFTLDALARKMREVLETPASSAAGP
jgi:two-component system, cell cycle sensor histidine kinase and response regulator CckA